ncbi:TPA: hypothetical protein ACOTG6_002750 [Clostridium perfringens]
MKNRSSGYTRKHMIYKIIYFKEHGGDKDYVYKTYFKDKITLEEFNTIWNKNENNLGLTES